MTTTTTWRHPWPDPSRPTVWQPIVYDNSEGEQRHRATQRQTGKHPHRDELVNLHGCSDGGRRALLHHRGRHRFRQVWGHDRPDDGGRLLAGPADGHGGRTVGRGRLVPAGARSPDQTVRRVPCRGHSFTGWPRSRSRELRDRQAGPVCRHTRSGRRLCRDVPVLRQIVYQIRSSTWVLKYHIILLWQEEIYVLWEISKFTFHC